MRKRNHTPVALRLDAGGGFFLKGTCRFKSNCRRTVAVGQQLPARLSVIVDNPIGFYALHPLLRKLARERCQLQLFARSNLLARLNKIDTELDLCPQPLDAIERQHLVLGRLHRLLSILMTRKSYSYQYRLLQNSHAKGASWRFRVAHAVSAAVPGVRHDIINSRIAACLAPLLRNPFPSPKVLVATLAQSPHLLCARGQSVFTVMESWDHPVKTPVGHASSTVFAWNEDLARDWAAHQGDRSVLVGYPLKLRYWLTRTLQDPPRNLRVAMYAAGTSSHSVLNDLHVEELRFIEDICQATQQVGWNLVIKPKPNGRVGDFDRIQERYRHVTVGMYRNATTTSDYYLDEAYNHQRLLELQGVSLVINTITTFALDAAVAGWPVLQVDLSGCSEYGALSECQKNHHISKYLLTGSTICREATSRVEVAQNLISYLTNQDTRAEEKSANLRQWLKPERSLAEAVEDMASTLLRSQA